MHRTIALYPFLYPFLLALFFLGQLGQASGEDIKDSVGRFVIAKGNVLVRHRDAPVAGAVKAKDAVFFRDLISTKRSSRAKVLFRDEDTVLTIAPDSTMEITEAVYDPGENQRKTVISLVSGVIKGLVMPSEGGGSKVSVQTTTAVAAVRGTRFIVAVEAGGTRILNISDSEHSKIEIKKAAAPGAVVPDTDPVIFLDPRESGFIPGGIGEIVIEPIPPPLLASLSQALESSGRAEDAILPVVVSTSDPGPKAMARDDKPLDDALLDDRPLPALIPDRIPDQQPSQPPNNVTIKVQIP